MKTTLIAISSVLSALFLFTCLISLIQTTFWLDLNPIKLYFSDQSAKDWRIPKGYAILYSQCDDKYMGKLPASETYEPNRLQIFHMFIPNDLWANYPEGASRFSDSVECKYYMKMYYDRIRLANIKQYKIDSINNCFKPLTK